MTPVTEREIGSIEQKIANLEHRVRNDKMIINALADQVDEVRLELNQFKYKVYGVSSAVIVFLGLLTLIIDFLKKV
mgnify:FL=1|tara:strand:+ start:474 stop:701 length:228 start_codon:yes stop_codon:yes gene_type:complete